MPPKKEEVETEKPRLGRPGNNVKIGIAGLPNVGKSTFFNLMCHMQVPAENFPFCTIDPTVSRAAVPDERWEWLCEYYKPERRLQAFLTLTDIAGLVRGAHQGEGLGNAFLSHIRAVDGIFHVVPTQGCFESVDIVHVDGGVDPVRDLETITDELRWKDLEQVTKEIEQLKGPVARAGKNVQKHIQVKWETLHKAKDALENKKQIRFVDWKTSEVEALNELLLLTSKPVIVLANLSEEDFVRKKNKWLPKIKQWQDEHAPGELLLPFSCSLENHLYHMDPEESKAYCDERKVKSMIPKLILSGYTALSLIHFFTVGDDEVKCWTIQKGTKAPQAAGIIHTDFERGFICAEVMRYDDFRTCGGESETKSMGKMKQHGREYKVQDGDIILFKFNVSGGGKKK